MLFSVSLRCLDENDWRRYKTLFWMLEMPVEQREGWKFRWREWSPTRNLWWSDKPKNYLHVGANTNSTYVLGEWDRTLQVLGPACSPSMVPWVTLSDFTCLFGWHSIEKMLVDMKFPSRDMFLRPHVNKVNCWLALGTWCMYVLSHHHV